MNADLLRSQHQDCFIHIHSHAFASRLQLFRIVEHTGKGGRTQLVDGFRVVQELKEQSPEVYKYLCDTPFEFQYSEPQVGRGWKDMGEWTKAERSIL